MIGELTIIQWVAIIFGGLAGIGALIAFGSLFFVGLIQFVFDKFMKHSPTKDVVTLVVEDKEEYTKKQEQTPIEQCLDNIQEAIEEVKKRLQTIEEIINDRPTS